MFLRTLSPRLVGCCAMLALTAPAWAQTAPVTSTAPAAAIAQPALPAQLQDFTAYVDAVRKQFDVPGIAVAIVKDGQVVLEQGYGVRELGKPEPVDARTRFAIASNTKAFTAAALLMLAALQMLPSDCYEAARVDDIHPLKVFWRSPGPC